MKRILLIAFTLLSLNAFAQKISPSELLINSTVQIICEKKVTENGISKSSWSSGTGFYFQFNSENSTIPVIVTNRHVLEGVSSITISFKFMTVDSLPDYKNSEELKLNASDLKIINHPDNKVDLAIIPILPIINYYKAKGKNLAYIPFVESNIPNEVQIKSLSAVEEILMVGYPFGLRDISNNVPIVRRGITATPFFLDYNSTKQFLCDIAVYPGSSGSPVLIFNIGSYNGKYGGLNAGNRVHLLGVNFATYSQDFTAKVLPTNTITTAIPYNVAIVIKSERILEFKTIIAKMK